MVKVNLVSWSIFVLSLYSSASTFAAHSEDGFQNEQPIPTKDELSVGLITFPPFIEKQDDGSCIGSAISDLTNIFTDTHYELVFYCAPPSRIYRDFQEGRIDITIHAKVNGPIDAHAIYSQQPYLQLEVVLYSRTNRRNNKVASIRGYNFVGSRLGLELQGFRFVDFANTKEAIAVFLRGSADSLLLYKKPFEYYLTTGMETGKYSKLDVTFAQQAIAVVPSHFVINTMHLGQENSLLLLTLL